MLMTTKNCFNEGNSILDMNSENHTPTISLIETESICNAYPFSKPESKKMKEKGKEILVLFKVKKKSRKEEEDNIRKKIKTFFHRYLRKVTNTKLEKAGSKYLFESFPQIFVTDITLKTNIEVMDLTYEQLFDYTYNQAYNDDKRDKGKDYIHRRKATAMKKYKRNIEVLEYLNKNEKTNEESGWEIIKNMKYIDLLKAYFNSNEFQQSVEEISEKETNAYINSYIYFASTYVDFFLTNQPKEKRNNQIKIPHPYLPNKMIINQNETPLLKFNSDDNKNFSEELSRIPSIFPPTFVEMEEDDYYSFCSFNFSRNYDNDLTNGNSIFNEENILFEKEESLII